MKGLDAARTIIGPFEFHEFRLLRELRILVTPDKGYPAIDLELCVQTESRRPAARICMRFHRISSLQIRDLGGEARIAGLNIADLSGDQLEGISWRVSDFEDGVIEFYARDAALIAASLVE